MPDIIKLSPESFRTIYLQAEDGSILETEAGSKIYIRRIIPSEWIPYRIYDYELALNENKRSINLVDKAFTEQITKEFKKTIAP